VCYTYHVTRIPKYYRSMVVLGVFDRLKENVVNFVLCILILIKVYLRGINCHLDYIYSTYIEIRLVETIPRDIYQNIVFLSQQHRISLSTISYFPYSKFSRFNALLNDTTFLSSIIHLFPLHKGDMKICSPSK
jgi:hypothetical protein